MRKRATNFIRNSLSLKSLEALFIMALFGGVFCVNTAEADVYASQLKVTNPDTTEFDGNFSDGSGARLFFTLNDTATVVNIDVIHVPSGEVVYEQDLADLGRGRHSIIWDGSGSTSSSSYIFEVRAEQPNYSDTEWTVTYNSGDVNIFSRGVDAVRDMDSDRFGLYEAPNTGGPLGTGIRLYNADGSFHDPALIAVDEEEGGSVDWGNSSDDIYSGVLDDEERFYVSAIPQGLVRRINRDSSVTPVVSGLRFPKGLYIDGTGADRVLYIADSNKVVRAAVGNDDVFTGELEVVGEFENAYPRNVALDDDGYLYVSFRAAADDLESDPEGLRKFDISGALPVTDGDSEWALGPEQTNRLASLEIDRGSDSGTSADDILYYATRAGNDDPADGIWRVDDINSFGPGVDQIVSDTALFADMADPDNANISDKAAIALDAAGNFIMMENANENMFFVAPPGDGATNSFVTTSPDTMEVMQGVAIDDPTGPISFQLHQNYPNPFKSSTTISYRLGQSGETTLTVYNTLGQEVRTLVSRQQAAGPHEIRWDGRNSAGTRVSSGVYVLRISSGTYENQIMMTLVK